VLALNKTLCGLIATLLVLIVACSSQPSGPRATVSAILSVDEPNFSGQELQSIMSALFDAGPLVGVYSSGLDTGTGQIRFGVLTEKSKTLIEEQADDIGIPLSMLAIMVRGMIELEDPPVLVVSEHGLEIDLRIAADPESEDAVEFEVVVTNNSAQTVDFTTGGSYPVDVVLFDQQGVQLWRYNPPVVPADGTGWEIPPGEAVHLAVAWDGKNDDQEKVPSGNYLVRGFMGYSVRENDRLVNTNLASAAIPFTLPAVPTVLILKPPTPAPQIEPTPDPYRDPRATVTAWFSDHEPPYKRISIPRLRTALWDGGFAPGVYMSGWDEVTEQFTFGVLTERTKISIEEWAAEIGIPQSMLSVEVRPPVGFGSAAFQLPGEEFETALEFEIALEVALYPGPGVTAEFTVVLTNISPQTIDFTTGGHYPADVVVFDSRGDQVWRHFPPILPADAALRQLTPGESLRLIVEWDGINDDQDVVPPGDYQARGYMNFPNTDLITATIPFTLSPGAPGR
jgi:hypothetical protein